MPNAPVRADGELIAYAERNGFVVTARQLRRYRAEGFLPHREVRSRGRARGVESSDPPGTRKQLLALCRYRERFPRSADGIAISLWYDGWVVSSKRVRSGVLRTFERVGAAARSRKNRAPVSRFERIAGRHLQQLDLDPAERPSVSRLIADARDDLAAIALRESRDLVSERLVVGYFQIDRAAELVRGEDVDRTAPKAMNALDLKRLTHELREAADDELANVRNFLRALFELLAQVRRESEGLPSFPPQFSEWLDVLGTGWDTRDPAYDPRELLIAIGGVLAYQREFRSTGAGKPH